MSLPHLQHLPNFFDFSPEDDRYTCIFPLASAQFRRCRKPINKKDRQSALALRNEICAFDPFEDGIEPYLQSYAQLCCCTQYHRVQIGDPPLLKQLSLQWKKQLRSAHVLESQEAVAGASNNAGHVDLATRDEADKFECLLHTDSTALKSPSPARRDDPPEHHDEITVVKETVPATPKGQCDSVTDDAATDHDSRISNRRPQEVVGQSNNSITQVNQCKREPAAPAVVQLRRIQTRSQTGSLPWSFLPRRRPEESTMLKTLIEPVSEYSSQVGVIYLYTRDTDAGYIKLGCTTRGPLVRMREWKKSCGYEPILLYTSEPVPYVRRLESLLKRELSLQGRGRQETHCKYNKHCRKDHTEWFEISLPEMQLLVDAWTNWMRDATPYRRLAKCNCKNAPLALIREEWQRHFESLSRRKIEIRHHCLQMQTSTRKLPVEHECPDDIHELKDEKECSKDHVSVKETLRKSLVQTSANTTKKGDAFRSFRRDREDITDKGLDRFGGDQQVEDNLLDNDVAAAAVVALLSSTLCQRITVNKVETSSTFNASRFSDATLGTGGNEIRFSPPERKPLLQITVY
jgi:hypothetical protein